MPVRNLSFSKSRWYPSLLHCASSLLILVAPMAQAQDVTQPSDEVTVGADTLNGASGRIAVNIAAGNGNQQLASAQLAIGGFPASRGVAQQAILTPDRADHSTSVAIADGAFANVSGLFSLNVSAGVQNQSANLAQLSLGASGALSDQMLAQTRATTSPNGGTAYAASSPNDAVELGDTAFADNRGLIQVNLVGGERNSSANTFQLSVSAGSPSQ